MFEAVAQGEQCYKTQNGMQEMRMLEGWMRGESQGRRIGDIGEEAGRIGITGPRKRSISERECQQYSLLQ